MEKNKKSVGEIIQEYGAFLALAVLVIGISIVSPEFRTGGNFLSLLRQSSINGLIAFGMTGVILTGGIDLSVGSVLALSTALCAGMISGGVPAGLAMLLALVIPQKSLQRPGQRCLPSRLTFIWSLLLHAFISSSVRHFRILPDSFFQMRPPSASWN